MNKNIEVEHGELALENEYGDIIIIPKKYAMEVRDMVKDNCNSCIDSLAQTLPKMESYAEDGTVIKGEDPDPKNPIKRLSKSYFRPEVVAESTGTREIKLPGLKHKQKELKITPTVATQELDEVVINVNKTQKKREKELEDKVDLTTDYTDTRYTQGINENPQNTEEVLEIQQFLSDKGYDLDPDKRFRNNGIDGIAGKVTKKAIEEYNSSIVKPKYYESVKETPEETSGLFSSGNERGFLGECKEEQCSEYVQNEIFRNVAKRNMNLTEADRKKWNEDVGITGDAWDLGNNILKSGGKQVDINQVQPGDVVGIHSGTQGDLLNQAKKAGRNYTHSGVVDKVNPDGSYYVLHNWHTSRDGKFVGQEYRTLVDPKTNKLSGFPGNGVQEVFRPNYQGDLVPKVKTRKDVKLVAKDQQNLKKGADKFIGVINDFETKDKFINYYGIDEKDYYTISQTALGIMGQETSFGENLFYASGIKEVGANLHKTIKRTDLGMAVEELTGYNFKSNEVSMGPGSMKLKSNFNGAELSLFGVTKDNIKNPDKAMLATMQKLTNDYKYYQNKGYGKQESIYRAIQKYNSGSLNKEVAGKTREEWAKDYDLDYVNKVINFAQDFNIQTGKGASAKTFIDDLSVKDNVVKWAKYVRNQS